MLEWVCPKCQRAVDPGFAACPFCGAGSIAVEDAAPAAAQRAGVRRGRQPFSWADVERGFRFGLGFVAALAVAYFLLFVAAYAWEHPEWIDRLSRVIRFR
jgi:hypothetical protein